MVETLFQITELFKKYKIHYCLIDGLAMMLHNGRANTVDIDFYVLVEDLKDVIETLKKEKIQADQRGDYQLKAKINGIPIDILYADQYVGSDVVKRAVDKALGNHIVRVATPEDIIILKSIADRTVDRRDIEELRELFKGKLDENYIQKTLLKIRKELES